MHQLEINIDVTEASRLNEPAHIAMTVCLPLTETLSSPPIVCFAKPGAGFSRNYFTTDLPGPTRGSQADWHSQRGWIFVTVDHLGVGDSSQHEPSRLTFEVVANGNLAAEAAILKQLVNGTLSDQFPPISNPVRLGIGQSMGGCLTVIQQGRHHCYDGIAVLGFSAVHTQPPTPPGHQKIITAWRVPKGNGGETYLLNDKTFTPAFRSARGKEPSPTDVVANSSAEAGLWHYYYDDVIEHLPESSELKKSPWVSSTIPGLISCVLTPGIIAPEAAAVETPVLIAVGERDVVADIKREPSAYSSARSVDIFVCPHMGHMHNFAGTRELFWQKIHRWGESIESDALKV